MAIGGDSMFEIITSAYDTEKALRFGPYSGYAWRDDPKHLLFHLARYKFCAKMLAGRSLVLEVGCGEAFATPILLQSFSLYHGIDIFDAIIAYNRLNQTDPSATFAVHNIIDSRLEGQFDAAFSLDVLEHIPKVNEDIFVANIAASLPAYAPCIIGTPNIESARFSSEIVRAEHINLHSHESLRSLLSRHFHNVFLFSMNDEVVHTGFYPMAHYLLALAVGPRSGKSVFS